METNVVNSAQGNVTRNLLEKYKSNNLIVYNLSVSILEMLHENGVLTDKDYMDASSIVASNHGLNNTSIFVSKLTWHKSPLEWYICMTKRRFIMNNLKEKLLKLCEQYKTSTEGINYLINYYINSLGWTEEEAIKYTIKLFDNGTIDEIKIIGGTDGKDN